MSSAIPFPPDSLGAPLAGLKILVMGTCQVGPLIASASASNQTLNHMLFEAYRHSEIPNVDLSATDAIVIALTLRHILYDATGHHLGRSDMAMARLKSRGEVDELIEKCMTAIDEKLVQLHAAYGSLPTFFLSYLEPSFNYSGLIFRGYKTNWTQLFIRNLNDRFYESISAFSNFYLVECNDILNFVGRMHIQDDVVLSASHNSFISDGDLTQDAQRIIPPRPNSSVYNFEQQQIVYGRKLWRQIGDCLKIIRQSGQVKLIIVDLDDTLWRGVAADDSVPHWARIEGWPMGFVECLLYFKSRGGLLAICSKNDEEPTVQRLRDIWHGAITVDDFVSIKINWQPKSINISEILAETNLLPENVVFIDDNPREIDEVMAGHPSIRCLGGSHYDWRSIVLASPETQVGVLTDESRRRTELVRAKIARETSAKTMSREGWLDSLGLEEILSVIRGVDGREYPRAFELINKTNQFNTTGKRWTNGEMAEFFANYGLCVVASLKDKTADNGIVGVTLVKPGEIVQSVLSCRVFSLGAEIAMGRFATILALKKSEGAKAYIVDTGKNFACHNFFEQLGYENRGDHYFATRPCENPTWIKVTAEPI